VGKDQGVERDFYSRIKLIVNVTVKGDAWRMGVLVIFVLRSQKGEGRGKWGGRVRNAQRVEENKVQWAKNQD
jgi:hypothetical protein